MCAHTHTHLVISSPCASTTVPPGATTNQHKKKALPATHHTLKRFGFQPVWLSSSTNECHPIRYRKTRSFLDHFHILTNVWGTEHSITISTERVALHSLFVVTGYSNSASTSCTLSTIQFAGLCYRQQQLADTNIICSIFKYSNIVKVVNLF